MYMGLSDIKILKEEAPNKIMALCHSLWIRCFSIQDRNGFLRISTQNNEEPYKLTFKWKILSQI